MTEKVVITRRYGRLFKVECFNFDGEKVAELPVTGVETKQNYDDIGITKLALHSIRVDTVDEFPIELNRPSS